jgi:hypothetical protein
MVTCQESVALENDLNVLIIETDAELENAV